MTDAGFEPMQVDGETDEEFLARRLKCRREHAEAVKADEAADEPPLPPPPPKIDPDDTYTI